MQIYLHVFHFIVMLKKYQSDDKCFILFYFHFILFLGVKSNTI